MATTDLFLIILFLCGILGGLIVIFVLQVRKLVTDPRAEDLKIAEQDLYDQVQYIGLADLSKTISGRKLVSLLKGEAPPTLWNQLEKDYWRVMKNEARANEIEHRALHEQQATHADDEFLSNR
jgi:hypothetical protein